MPAPRSTPPNGAPNLLDLLRRQLGAEGRAPSRARLAAWISAGAARVDGRCVRDPAASVEPGARVSFDVEGLGSEGALPVRPARPASRAPLPPGVLFADAQLVVVERAHFAAADGPALAAEVAALLARPALHAPLDPSAPGGGPLPLAGSQAGRRRLEEDLHDGRVLETLLSLRMPPQAGPGEVVLELGTFSETTSSEDTSSAAFGLLRREEAPPAPPPPGTRELVLPQRLALVLKHPRTNRRLCFEVEPAPYFLAVCARLGVSGGPGGAGP